MLALANDTVTKELYERAKNALAVYLAAVNNAVSVDGAFITNGRLTLADICFCCEYALFMRERKRKKSLSALQLSPIVSLDIETEFPSAITHFRRLCEHEAFSPDLGPFLREQT